MGIAEEVLAANREAAAELATDAGARPTRRMVVLTCMDARLRVFGMLGLKRGEAHVIRNAGGRASRDALRSLLLSTYVLGTRTVLVIHHTDCGLSLGAEGTLHAVRDAGGEPGDLDLMAFEDLEQSVIDDVESIVGAQMLPDDVVVHGLVYEVESGRLRQVTTQPS